jgi:hypothetical protein
MRLLRMLDPLIRGIEQGEGRKAGFPAFRLLALCSMLFALCSSSAHAVPPFWTESRQLSFGPAFSSEVDACSRDDEVYVVWSDSRTGNKEIFFTVSQNAGQMWSNEERLTDTPGESTEPAIASDRENLYVVWREKRELKLAAPDVSQICYKRWDGETWSDDLVLSDGYENSRRPDIASTTLSPGSYLYVVWDSTENGKTTAYLTRSTDGGRSFSEPQPVTPGNWSTREPAIWGGARDAYLAWVDNRGGVWDIFFKRWGEVQAGPDIKLSSLPDSHSPAISGSEPGIYVAWECVERSTGGGEPLPYADIFFSFSADHGATWAGGERLTEGKAESVFPKIAVGSQAGIPMPLIFWQDGRNGEWQVFFSMLDEEHKPNLATPLTDIGNPSTLLDVVSTPGQIHAFWTRSESHSQASIMYIRRDTVAPKRPGTPSHFDLTAVPGYDDDNQITFSWEASIEGTAKYNIYFRSDDEDFAPIGSTEIPSYNVPGETGKTYQVYVEAVDEVGNVSVPSEISSKVICDPDAPEVMIHSPHSNSTIRGTTPIVASVHDLNLLEYSVEYGITAVPSVWWRLAGPFHEEADRKRIMTWETSDLDGIYILRISARDEAGNESKVEAMVDVDSLPPIPMSPGEVVILTEPDVEWTYGMPAWSPGGDKIAFHSDEGGTEDIWVMSPDGSGRMRLTRSAAVEHNPAWSPSGNMIAFQSLPVTGRESRVTGWDIWVVRASGVGAYGNTPLQITSDASSDMNPVWSPDGSSIAFDSDRDGDSEIWLMANIQHVLIGAKPQLVQLTDNDWEDKHPTWSPDGSKIIFQSSRRGNWDLFEIGIDGINPNTVIATSADEIEPDWSPDGKRVLFSTNDPGDHYEIYTIDWPVGQAGMSVLPVRLSPEDEDARHAHWSPAMNSIVYEYGGSLRSAGLVYPIGHLEAIISRPRGREVLTGVVDVEGVARGRNFQRYGLYYGLMNLSAYEPISPQFQLIGGESTSPVLETSFLGRWHTEELEGEYLLKLVVTGNDGGYVEDSVRVLIANQLPFILVDEPQDGLVTDKPVITVRGSAEQRAIVTLNDSEVRLDTDGSFSRKVQLSEGPNNIVIKARRPSSQGGEYVVERTVVLDIKPPKITLESPEDFQVVQVPYITVKGRADEKAEVNILGTRVWPDENGHFQREISIKEGINPVSVVAFDELGHLCKLLRRVIFLRETETASDTSAPAITDVFPGNRGIVTGRNLLISATLVDDVGLDPLSIAFSFDGEEIASEEYDLDIEIPDGAEDFPLDQYPIIRFTYGPIPPVTEGEHSFEIRVQDTSGNAAEAAFALSIDTVPSEAIVSALPTGILPDLSFPKVGSKGDLTVKVIAAASKPLARISSASVISESGGLERGEVPSRGYSLSSFVEKDGYYEASIDISPSQRNFIIDFAARTYLGDEVRAHGYMAWDEARSGERIDMGFEGGPQFSSSSISDRTSKLIVVLRSQDGLDADLLALQRSDAEYRRLQPSGLVYVLSASEEFKEGEAQGILSLPIPNASIQYPASNIQHLVMFHWNEELKQWQSLDRIGLTEDSLYSPLAKGVTPSLALWEAPASLPLWEAPALLPLWKAPALLPLWKGGRGDLVESQITVPGIYALFADVEPPVIEGVSPMDAGEVPVDRFFVEASVSDRGSGISQIRFMVDGKQADYDYNPLQKRLTYFPGRLQQGLHNMEITATDRAGNVAEFSTSFVKRESFQFTTVRVYPNPANGNVSIEFKLTGLADVTLRIYTIAGDLIYSRDMGKAAEGRFVWKCENSAGSRVASGIYIYSMEAAFYETKIREQGAIAVIM